MKILLAVLLFTSTSVFAQSSFESKTRFNSEVINTIVEFSLDEKENGLWDFRYDPNSCSQTSMGMTCTLAEPEVFEDVTLSRIEGPSIPELSRFNIGESGYKFQINSSFSSLKYQICDSNVCTDVTAFTFLAPIEL